MFVLCVKRYRKIVCILMYDSLLHCFDTRVYFPLLGGCSWRFFPVRIRYTVSRFMTLCSQCSRSAKRLIRRWETGQDKSRSLFTVPPQVSGYLCLDWWSE